MGIPLTRPAWLTDPRPPCRDVGHGLVWAGRAVLEQRVSHHSSGRKRPGSWCSSPESTCTRLSYPPLSAPGWPAVWKLISHLPTTCRSTSPDPKETSFPLLSRFPLEPLLLGRAYQTGLWGLPCPPLSFLHSHLVVTFLLSNYMLPSEVIIQLKLRGNFRGSEGIQYSSGRFKACIEMFSPGNRVDLI